MKPSRILLYAGIFFALISFLTPRSFAGEGTTGDYARDMGVQFGRGLWNIVSSPAEIPCGIRDDMQVNAGTGFFTGLGKGLAFFVRRAVIGVSEVVTFIMPEGRTIAPVCAAKTATAVQST